MPRRQVTTRIAPLLAATLLAASAGAQTITATIDAGAKGPPISPLIYGMFIEHAGSLLEQWARHAARCAPRPDQENPFAGNGKLQIDENIVHQARPIRVLLWITPMLFAPMLFAPTDR